MATGDVGRRRPIGGQPTGGHVPLVQAGQAGRGRARDVPRAVDRPRQLQVELELGHDGRPVFAYPAAVSRHAHRHYWRHHAVLGLAVFAEKPTRTNAVNVITSSRSREFFRSRVGGYGKLRIGEFVSRFRIFWTDKRAISMVPYKYRG